MGLTKDALVKKLYDEIGLSKRDANVLVNLFFEEIKACLANNQPVKLSGFGTFSLKNKAQRPGRNPKTGEAIPIMARRVVVFHAGPSLRLRIGEL